jgi:type I restriction enzyme S subunit
MNRENVPKLRFPGFDGEWERSKIGDNLTIGSGKDYKHLEIGDIPVFGTGGLMTYVNKFLYDGETVCIGRKGTIDKPMFYNGKIWTVDTLFYTHSFNSSLPKFIFNVFQRINWKEHNEASGVPSLSKSTIEKINISIPTLPEQQKIASFLSAVDEKIQQLSRKKKLLEQYKKGVMQQLFSGKLRFKDENGKEYPDWEEKKLGKCLDYIQPTKYLVSSTEYDNSFKTPVLTAGKTFILGYTDETNGIFENNLPVIIFDDFTTATKFVDFPFKAKSSAMKILVPFKNVNIKFIYEAMQIMKYEIGGHERHWISKFSQILMPFPSLPEQQKIANFLSGIDGKIEQVNGELVKTQEFKKGLLQQMFV